jgi:3-keto-5-aminohexanoate cleavage enzyme
LGKNQWLLAAAALSMGGNVRVGLEDNLYLPTGELAKSNGELVAHAARLVRMLGGAVASVVEARAILGLAR